MRRSYAALLSAALSLGTAPLARAAPVKGPPPTEDLGKKATTAAPDKSLAGDITRKKAEKKETGPSVQYDQFAFTVELQVASKRHEQIEYLQKIIQLGADEKEMPTLLFRLAELYWEESKYYFFEANRKDDEIFKAKDKKDDAAAAQATEEKNTLVARSQKFQTEAVERYREILDKYPKFARMDEVLYFLGHNLWDANKEQDALAIYKTLITRFPKSKFIPDAWLAFGEFYFNGSNGKKEEVEKALASYKHAAEFQDSSGYGFALYKQAWCYYNLNDFKSALDLFKTVIFYGDFATSTQKDNKTALVKEARKDYVLTYSHFGDPLGAEEDFKKVGGPDNWKGMLEGLAGLFYEDGKDKEAVLTYRRLIQLDPISPKAPLFQSRIVDAVMRVGKKQITLEQVRTLVRVIDEVKKSNRDKWKPEEKKSLAEAEDLSERTISNLAVTWHQEAKKTRDEPTFAFANEVYSDYIAIFPDSKKSYDLRFYWAELMNDNLLKFDKAAEQYSFVLNMDAKKIEKQEKPGKWLPNAALNAVFAYREVVKKFNDPVPPADANKPSPIPESKKKLLEACENYIKFVPKGDKVVEISYEAAKIDYDYNHLEEASKRFDDICDNHPEHQLAEYSCNLVLDTKNLKGDLSGVYDSAKKYLANEALIKAHPSMQPQLKTLLEQTSFKLVSALEGKGQYVAAAKKYLGYVDEFPKGSLSDTALFNASVDFFKGHHFDDALAARGRLVKEFPNSKYVPDAVYDNGQAAASVGDFQAAAESLEEYTKRFQKQSGIQPGKRGHSGNRKPQPTAKKGKGKDDEKPAADQPTWDEKKAQDALYDAGVFREGLGQFKQALADRQLYLDLWPDSKDAETVFLSIANLYEREGNTSKASNQYLEFEKQNQGKPDKVLMGEAKIVRVYEKAGQKGPAKRKREDMFKYYDRLRSDQKKTIDGLAMEQIAQAHLEKQEEWFVEFNRVKLRFPVDNLKKGLKNKAERLQDLQKRYTETVNFKAGGPAICAFTKLGEAYAAFEDALITIPLPQGLKQEEQDGVREGFEQQAQPLHAKAAEALATAVSESRRLGINNECTERATAALADKYAPDQFPKVTETFAEVKGLTETKSGAGLLTGVQPLPTKDAADEEAPAKLDAPPIAARVVEKEPAAVKPASPEADNDLPATPKPKATPKANDPKPKTDEPSDDLVQ
jgi:tetratricopeptide (TPR) repeat protein